MIIDFDEDFPFSPSLNIKDEDAKKKAEFSMIQNIINYGSIDTPREIVGDRWFPKHYKGQTIGLIKSLCIYIWYIPVTI